MKVKAPRVNSIEYRKQRMLEYVEDALEGTREPRPLTTEQVAGLLSDFARALTNGKHAIEMARNDAQLHRAIAWTDGWHMADLNLRSAVRGAKGVNPWST